MGCVSLKEALQKLFKRKEKQEKHRFASGIQQRWLKNILSIMAVIVVLVGVAFIGDEYRYDDNDDLDPILEGDDPDDRTTVCVNDLMFFRIFDGEMIWRPRLPVEMCGKRFDFRQYNIELPRVGKDVKLTHLGDPKQSVVLRWNGRRFDVVKMK